MHYSYLPYNMHSLRCLVFSSSGGCGGNYFYDVPHGINSEGQHFPSKLGLVLIVVEI